MSNDSSDASGNLAPEPPAAVGPPGGGGVKLDSAPTAATPATNYPHPVVAGLLVIGVFLASQVVASLLVGALARTSGGHAAAGQLTLFGSPVLLQFAFILVAEGLVLAFLGWYLRGRGVKLAELGWTKPRWGDIGWAVLAFFAYFAAYIILVQVVQALVPGFNADQKQDTGFDGASGFLPLALVFFALVVLAPVTEETLLRGFFFGSLRRRYKYLVSALATSLVFGALHLGGGEPGDGLLWVAAVDTFVLSLALCYLRERTGRLWSSVLLHATKNLIAFLALFIFAGGG